LKRKYDRVVRIALTAQTFAVLVVLGATACGGGSTKAGSTGVNSASSASASIAAAIKARLKAAGYPIFPEALYRSVYLGRAAGGGFNTAREPVLPPGTPTPVAAFKTQVDFTSPNNFELVIYVFATHTDATIAAKNNANAARNILGNCLKQPLCRQNHALLIARCHKAPACLHRLKLTDQRAEQGAQQRVLGPALYTAYVPSGKSTHDFNTVVALAAR
jgi:hypothetical protein